MVEFIFQTFKLLRPKQWMKNFLVFAAIVFTGQLLNLVSFESACIAFIVFCFTSSGIYIFNDIFDIQKDRKHPFKRFRPLASGKLPVWYAVILAIILLSGSLYASLFSLSFFVVMCVYVILQVLYSLILKHIEVIDILVLAAGYVLRAYGGEVATNSHMSVWLALTTVAVSLFLAVGKRKGELTLIGKLPEKAMEQIRPTLSHYSDQLLDVYASIFATATFVFYTLFTFLESVGNGKITIGILLPDYLPSFLQRKWLMITIVPVVYGLMRYLQDIYEKHEGESPEKVFLSDRPLIIAVGIWVLLVVGIIYFIQS